MENRVSVLQCGQKESGTMNKVLDKFFTKAGNGTVRLLSFKDLLALFIK